jgi:hypothetical protein
MKEEGRDNYIGYVPVLNTKLCCGIQGVARTVFSPDVVHIGQLPCHHAPGPVSGRRGRRVICVKVMVSLAAFSPRTLDNQPGQTRTRDDITAHINWAYCASLIGLYCYIYIFTIALQVLNN